MNVLPDYGGASLADVLPAVGRALGMPGEGALELPPASAYIVVLLDGLGAELLARHTEQTPFLSSGSMRVGTCGVPSTTATSLTSLGTALPPGAHGLVGFTSRIPGTDRLLQALRWDKSVDPQRWQPHEPYFGTLERHGIATTVISKAEFEHSGLTQCGQRGARFVGAQTLTERVDHAVRAAQRAPSVTYIYDNDPDHTGHAARCWFGTLARCSR
ncbi:MAG: alkaline phosphatase family protein [Marmoricola sp.]